MPMKKGQKQTRLNAVLFAILLDDLVSGPATWHELVECTGLGRNTVLGVLRALYKRKLIHIAAWEEDPRGVPTIRAYAFGKKPDAKQPRKSKEDINRTYRQRRGTTALRANIFADPAANEGTRQAA
jgi:transcription initiation factor IIE alpha subunit